ncbi:MAG TPA: methenyltetrahydromethanopterin cyclohydrolase [Methanothermococcus okinawensis]|uniref:Methenyltetrahydromethanopterin cyclohydrolase n=1 Tax=Methanothermococcus okinawensis TaxID=155863 RepID=A0A832ZHF8_9EURY|nr:methenyltetrahydromethanopterin cyclohydrolase [Methanococcaceae archaeon]HIP84977.1 methenyltetrahydromethanopterin cyclohydrolase [Methanothermococcus okinawensis]HIP91260.1 methenyltetrahydromethanopterin cyclohydrolase [Methanothermococcus okinawensis]
MLSVNLKALPIVEDMIERREELNIEVKTLENGAKVIDCGVNVPGSFEAGKAFTKVCLGGLAEVGIALEEGLNEELSLPSIKVITSHPAVSTLGSQKAGWVVKVGNYFAMGSGPARALARIPKSTYEKIGYEDNAQVAILCLEASKLPDEEVAQYVAEKCGVEVENVYLLVAPTASLVGSIQISGRVVENGTYKMLEVLNFDVKKVKYGAGIAPIAPIVGDDLVMMGATNDMVLYGGKTYYYLESDEGDDIEELCRKLPSCASPDYGKPFLEVFKAANYDFYKIDKGIFAPALVTLNDMRTGKLVSSGKINVEVIKRSLNYKRV